MTSINPVSARPPSLLLASSALIILLQIHSLPLLNTWPNDPQTGFSTKLSNMCCPSAAVFTNPVHLGSRQREVHHLNSCYINFKDALSLDRSDCLLLPGVTHSFVFHCFFFFPALTDTAIVVEWPILSLPEHLGESIAATRLHPPLYHFSTAEMLN